jgi:hypothetical protein
MAFYPVAPLDKCQRKGAPHMGNMEKYLNYFASASHKYGQEVIQSDLFKLKNYQTLPDIRQLVRSLLF